LSSSAALEVATAETFRVLGEFDISRPDLALLCQAAEHEFVGVQCGIMDQFVSTLAAAGCALFLDCRDLSYDLVPLSSETSVVVCDSRVQRALDGSAYNRRRDECEQAVQILDSAIEGIDALRDVTLAELEENSPLLPRAILNRARHVISENERVLRGVRVLQEGQIEQFGELLFESHASLRDDYEVSCRELDVLVELAADAPGILGARMTGAGFGGCTINLVRSQEVAAFQESVAAGYTARTGLESEIYVCRPSEGVTSEART
jgi:galactokinase